MQCLILIASECGLTTHLVIPGDLGRLITTEILMSMIKVVWGITSIYESLSIEIYFYL